MRSPSISDSYLKEELKNQFSPRFLTKPIEDRSLSSRRTVAGLTWLLLTTSLLLKPLVLLSKKSLIILTRDWVPSIFPKISIFKLYCFRNKKTTLFEGYFFIDYFLF